VRNPRDLQRTTVELTNWPRRPRNQSTTNSAKDWRGSPPDARSEPISEPPCS